MIFSSLAASCRCCAENPLIPAVQIFAATSRHEAYHLSLLVIEDAGKWQGIDEIREEALTLAECISDMAGILEIYRGRGWSIKDEPLVLLSERMADIGDIAGLGASPHLVALVREIIRPKPLKPALRGVFNVLAGVALVAVAATAN